MKRKRILIISAAALLCSTVLLLLIFTLAEPEEPAPRGRILCFLHLYSSPAKETLTDILEKFNLTYPQIDLEYTILPYQDMLKALDPALETETDKETIILTALSGREFDLHSNINIPESSWTGSRWELFFNEERLNTLGLDQDTLRELGSEGFSSFLSSLKDRTDPGEYLFFTGANYSWPWLAWIQHLQLSESGGIQPPGYSLSDWERGISGWRELIENGWMNPDFRQQNWARSQFSISEGKSLFVLSDSGIYNIYLPGERNKIEAIPFPGSEQGGWQVGSSFYLCLIGPEGTVPETVLAGELLRDYLSSNGIRQRFLEKTGIILNEQSSIGINREIPSITHKVRDPELMELIDLIR